MRPIDLQTLQANVIVHPTEFDGKTQLLKISHIGVMKHGGNKAGADLEVSSLLASFHGTGSC